MAMKRKNLTDQIEYQRNVNNLGNVSIGWLKDLFNKLLVERKMPEYWRKKFIVTIFKFLRKRRLIRMKYKAYESNYENLRNGYKGKNRN